MVHKIPQIPNMKPVSPTGFESEACGTWTNGTHYAARFQTLLFLQTVHNGHAPNKVVTEDIPRVRVADARSQSSSPALNNVCSITSTLLTASGD